MAIVINPITPEQLERRRLAQLIAKQKQIKYKSAMRYIQRASAPVGKQRIQKPTFAGIKPALKKRVISYVEFEKQKQTKPKDFFEYLRQTGREIQAEIDAGTQKFRQLTVADLKRGDKLDILDWLAAFSNIYDNPENILDVDEDLILRAVAGERLDRGEDDELNGQFIHMKRDEQLQREHGIDLDYLEREATVVHNILRKIMDRPMEDIFREAIALKEVSLDTIERGYSLFGELESKRVHVILDAYHEYSQTGLYRCWDYDGQKWIQSTKAIDLNEMFELYLEDGTTTTDVMDSMFWAWFRELFYC